VDVSGYWYRTRGKTNTMVEGNDLGQRHCVNRAICDNHELFDEFQCQRLNHDGRFGQADESQPSAIPSVSSSRTFNYPSNLSYIFTYTCSILGQVRAIHIHVLKPIQSIASPTIIPRTLKWVRSCIAENIHIGLRSVLRSVLVGKLFHSQSDSHSSKGHPVCFNDLRSEQETT
jgi:hypothetical protein